MNKINYNPDVITCLANLSNDEVFTSPTIANQMLDTLPNDLWSNSKATFLDPFSKSGVFLREIAKRLIIGLEKEIPDLQERVNHIMKNQIYGIAITELTSLLTRRSLYCTKLADNEKSIVTIFNNANGNIAYERIEHTWEKGKCKHCGASQEIYDRETDLESYAYQFIHNQNPYINMQFDVIIGNPPYQLNDGGGTGSSAIPIYHLFVQRAKKTNPRYLCMITPSRWFSGGRGLDEFRSEMLNDRRIRIIHDFIRADDIFPGVEIKGGVNYFLWDRDNMGHCKVFTHSEKSIISESERPLLENNTETFIRYNEAISILRKVHILKEKSFPEIISSNDPFGFDIRVYGSYKRVKPKFKKTPFKDAIKFYYYGWQKEGVGYIEKDSIRKNIDLILDYKVIIPKAWGIGNMANDWLNPLIIGSNSCCTETYLIIGPFATKLMAENVVSYTQTKFFHLLVSLIKITQNAMKKVYQFVPMQNFNEEWTDEKLYKKYGLNQEEIDFIESMIRPME